MENSIVNNWTFFGEIFYLKELQGEFAGSLRIRGTAQRKGSQSSQIVEMGCLMQEPLYKELVERGYKVYSKICLSGHLESWFKGGAVKTMFIADEIIEQ